MLSKLEIKFNREFIENINMGALRLSPQHLLASIRSQNHVKYSLNPSSLTGYSAQILNPNHAIHEKDLIIWVN